MSSKIQGKRDNELNSTWKRMSYNSSVQVVDVTESYAIAPDSGSTTTPEAPSYPLNANVNSSGHTTCDVTIVDNSISAEFDENAYWEKQRIQDEIDEMNDHNREMDEMFEHYERLEEEIEQKERRAQIAKEKKERRAQIAKDLEDLPKSLTFTENGDGTLNLVKRADCKMNINIYKVN